jgi:hypothetical protein
MINQGGFPPMNHATASLRFGASSCTLNYQPKFRFASCACRRWAALYVPTKDEAVTLHAAHTTTSEGEQHG